VRNIGHNERSYRLDALAAEAREGLERVEKGEEFTIGGWLAYGHALNEGRALFPGDKEFGEWIDANALRQVVGADGTLREVYDPERAAARWAAANADQFEEARQRGNPRTIRGIHAKWKEIEAEHAEEERRKAAEDSRRSAEQDQQAVQAPVQKPAGQEPVADKAGTSVALPAADGPEADDHDPVHAQKLDATPDPHAKLRAEFRALTREAQEDDWIGLRLEVAEGRKRIAKQRGDIADLKQQIKQLSEGDQGKTISALHKQIGAAKYARDEAMAASKRMEYRMKKAIEERDKANATLEGQEIVL
jgi:hypothetical protein